MNMKILDKYIIEYTNHFKVNGQTFAFRKKELFNITKVPQIMSIIDNNGSKGYWINREWLSLSKIKEIIVNEPINVDVSSLQWDRQIEIDYVFNLN